MDQVSNRAFRSFEFGNHLGFGICHLGFVTLLTLSGQAKGLISLFHEGLDLFPEFFLIERKRILSNRPGIKPISVSLKEVDGPD